MSHAFPGPEESIGRRPRVRRGYVLAVLTLIVSLLVVWHYAGIAGERGHGVTLYLDVDDIDAVERAMRGVEVVVPRRTTFYGAEEIFVRAPCGTVVGFARHGAEPA